MQQEACRPWASRAPQQSSLVLGQRLGTRKTDTNTNREQQLEQPGGASLLVWSPLSLETSPIPSSGRHRGPPLWRRPPWWCWCRFPLPRRWGVPRCFTCGFDDLGRCESGRWSWTSSTQSCRWGLQRRHGRGLRRHLAWSARPPPRGVLRAADAGACQAVLHDCEGTTVAPLTRAAEPQGEPRALDAVHVRDLRFARRARSYPGHAVAVRQGSSWPRALAEGIVSRWRVARRPSVRGLCLAARHRAPRLCEPRPRHAPRQFPHRARLFVHELGARWRGRSSGASRGSFATSVWTSWPSSRRPPGARVGGSPMGTSSPWAASASGAPKFSFGRAWSAKRRAEWPMPPSGPSSPMSAGRCSTGPACSWASGSSCRGSWATCRPPADHLREGRPQARRADRRADCGARRT